MRQRIDDTYRGKVAMITGAGSGLGKALALVLASSGAIVVACDVDTYSLDSVSSEITQIGGNVESFVLDVTNPTRVAFEIAEVARRHAGLDYLFNCAGVGLKGEVRDVMDEQWRRLVDVNLWGVIHTTRAAYREMVERRTGHIVNIASLSGLVPVPGVAAYGAMKHAVVGLTTALRAEGEGLGIRVTVVCPGPIATGFQAGMMLAGIPDGSGGRRSRGYHWIRRGRGSRF